MATLAAQAIPDATTQTVRRAYRGASFQLADGTVKHDLVNSSAKSILTITWQAITAAQLTAIQTGYDALTASGTYTDHNSTAWTVLQDEGLPPLEYEEVNAASGPRYNVSLTLRQV
jgi:hypothetical protein